MNTASTPIDALQQLATLGYDTSGVPTTPTVNKPHRCPAPGKGKSNDAAYIYVNEDRVVAGDFSTDEKIVIRLGQSEADGGEDAKINAAAREQQRIARERQDQNKKSAAQKRAIHIYRAATPVTDADAHTYLKQKRITGEGIEQLGLRVDQYKGENRLIVPVYNADGELFTIQTINEIGKKRYFAGAGFTGGRLTIPGVGQTILVEGLATGWTVNQATGQPVMVAFSADNLKTIAADYPDAVIATDNDNAERSTHHKEVERRGTGHKKALETGLPVYMPPVPGMDFNDLGVGHTRYIFTCPPVSARPVYKVSEIGQPVTQINGKKVPTLDKCLSALGRTKDPAEAAAIAKLARNKAMGAWYTPMQTRMAIEFADDEGVLHPVTLDRLARSARAIYDMRRQGTRKGATILHSAARHQVERLDALKGLRESEMKGVVVLSAPMASGKTQIVGHPLVRQSVSKGKTTLALCHSRALVKSLANRLGMYSYTDIDAETLQLAQQDGLATCLPSICRSDHASLINNTEVVFIDEIAQVIDMLDSSVCKTKEADQIAIYSQLVKIIRDAETVVVADAHVNDRVIEFLEFCRPGETFNIKQVAPSKDAKVSAVYRRGQSEGPSHVANQAIAEIRNGGKVWIACESIKKVEEVSRTLSEYTDNVLALTGDNKGNDAQAAFLEDIEGQSREYDAVVVSPVISSGVSIEHRDGEHFTLGGFIGSGNAVSPLDAMQMMGRVRYLRRWVVGFTTNNAIAGRSADQIIDALGRADALETGETDRITGYDSLISKSRAERTNLRADFAFGLVTVLGDAGWTVTEAEHSESEATVGQCMKDLTAEIAEAKRQVLLDAPIIDAQEADRIKRAEATTKDEAIALEAHRLRETLGLRGEAITEDDVKFWAGGRAMQLLGRFEAFRRVPKRVDSKSPVTQKRFHHAQASAYSEIFEGVDLDNGYSRADAQQAVDRVMAYPHYYIEIGVAPASWRARKPKDPIKAVGAMLEMIGLKARSIGQSRCHTSEEVWSKPTPQTVPPQSGTRTRLYALDTGVLAQVEAYAKARAALRADDEVAFATGTWPQAGTDRSDEADPLAPGYAEAVDRGADRPPEPRSRGCDQGMMR